MKNPWILATRGSALAVAQAHIVEKLLEKKGIRVEIRTVSTGGDRDRTRPLSEIGGKGLFVKEVERELLEGRADIAVHSGKDLPYELAEGTVIAGVPAAESSSDCLLTRKGEELPERPRIGTGSPRRIVQCRKFLPDAEYVSIRGNVDTRLRKLREGEYDGILLAKAGLNRLHCDVSDLEMREFRPEEFLPAACQGILAVQCREEDTEVREILKGISDPATAQRLEAERYMLRLTGADCSQSVGAHASLEGDRLTMRVLLGEKEAQGSAPYEEYKELCEGLFLKVQDEEQTQDEAQSTGKTAKQAGTAVGSVTLVGAGCGKDLITVKGLKALRQAEVILYDDLLDPGLLAEARPDAEILYVGKRSGKHSEKQERIQELLIEKAREGKRVVRLKGGDSYVFGRGGEEILALKEAGIPCMVIPGVTSAVAVPGHAGIPVTHRGIAQSVTIITGHSATEKEENFAALAGLDGTLVFLMGLQNAAHIADKLMQNGKAPGTPAAIISRGFSAEEKRINGTLGDIGEKAKQAETPAILVIGPTAGFHLEPTLKKPLEGVSATLVGTDRFIRKLAGLLEEAGAETALCPVLRIQTVPENIPGDLTGYRWAVFTSAQGVLSFFAEREKRGLDIRSLAHLRFACIGEGTSEKLRKHGILTDLEPEEFTARALGQALAAENVQDVCILRAENGSPDLTEELDKAGIAYTDAKIYRTEADPDAFAGLHGESTYTVFASGNGVRQYFAVCTLPEDTVPVCIGPSTEKVFRQLSSRECLTADPHTAAGIVQLIRQREAGKQCG